MWLAFAFQMWRSRNERDIHIPAARLSLLVGERLRLAGAHPLSSDKWQSERSMKKIASADQPLGMRIFNFVLLSAAEAKVSEIAHFLRRHWHISLLDTCQGDSGGPIMYYSQDDRAWTLTGITSYGRGCGLPNYAGVYTRVSAYMEWIQSIVGNDGVVFIPQNNANLSRLSTVMIITALMLSIWAPIHNSIHWSQSHHPTPAVNW